MTKRGPLIEPVDASPESLRQLAYGDPEAFPVLLDSSATGPLGRFSILAAYPQASLWLDQGGALHAEGLTLSAPPGGAQSAAAQALPQHSGFLEALQAAWRAAASPGSSDPATTPRQRTQTQTQQIRTRQTLPFRGGWLVFLGYEIAREVEPLLQLPPAVPEERVGPVALALRIPAALVFDHVTRQAWCVAESPALLAALRGAAAALPTGTSPQGSAATPLPALQLIEEPPERFQRRVEAALEYIRAGDIYQANLSRPWRGRFDGATTATATATAATAAITDASLAAALYERLRAANPAPFAALAQFRDWRLLCSSPERLVQVADGRVQTRPIAGTRPRSREAGRDEREIAALIAHPKERAEHVMLVDLERNDLGRICEGGSVVADEMMFTESYAHVHHIVSNVSGRLRAELTPVDVLRAVFPGGTITGCPKFRCMQIIAELEAEARGAYTGTIGYINHDGSMDFNILIRTLTLRGRKLSFRAGGGIVADSKWHRELEETRAKARGLLAALQGPAAP